MDEKRFKRSGRQPPPSSYPIIYKTQRSRSLSSEKEQGPPLQTVPIKEPKLSAANKIELTPRLERRLKVGELIERFENVESVDNIRLNKFSSSLLTRYTNGRLSARDIWASSSSTGQKKITRTQLTSPIRSLTLIEERLPSNMKNIPDSISHYRNFNNLTTSNEHQSRHTSKSNVTSATKLPKSMIQTKQSSPQHPEIYIKSQQAEIENTVVSRLALESPSKHDEQFEPSASVEFKDHDTKKTIGFNKRLEEIHKTENNYITKLYVLTFKMPKIVKEICQRDENVLKSFNDIYQPLLATLKQLYLFHYENILPCMEQFITGHRTDLIWSIFEEHFQTIENLYKEYYTIYDENQQKFERLCATNALLHTAMLDCQCLMGNLYPINELNCANQHLLRYILLMKSYMKYLDKDSSEYERTCFVHDELTSIAERCEEHLAISSAQLNKLKQRVDSKLDCFEKQQLIWYGSLKKQSPRKHTDISPVYIILFSECILVCGESGNKLEVKRQLSIGKVSVEIIERERMASTSSNVTNAQQSISTTYYPFRVSATEKVYEFIAEKESDREKWVNKIRQASEEFKRRNSTIAIRQSHHRFDETQLGARAPVWVNDTDVTRCQLCHHLFSSKLISRRHHCRSCGRCICNSCSTKKLLLKYCSKQGEKRICDLCYDSFTGIKRHPKLCLKITRDPNKMILFGDFRYFQSKSMIWIELQEDFQLHAFNAKLDQVEDFSINLLEINEILFIKETQTFILDGKDKTYKLSLEINHQITYPKNDYIDKNLQNANNKLFFFANLWYDTMQSARLRTTPLWYIRKRDSADSGISNN
ncbi:unnamed protein product [Rotaria magnacalcarata]|uniref:Uncharacterized protein n=1 Tax=Rotaria magnacalcarata TaxID=392030 RepID=A0A815HU74_9BILA|nr:unnamed protein product [Rotaria magnacalcarata]